MISRRQFIASITSAAAAPQLGGCASGFTNATLRHDTAKLLDLAEGFRYQIISKAGTRMSDGLLVPGAHDGMAAFPAEEGRLAIVCNHELYPHWIKHSAFGQTLRGTDERVQKALYDSGDGHRPGLGGTTTSIYNPASRKVERQFMSLGGTEGNCAGGPTPWNSWLSCEEIFSSAGNSVRDGLSITRARDHGYVFEVPASATGIVKAEPIKAMGRFEHEAASVDANTGIVYMTEDRHHSLFYRYIPRVPGRLAQGGQLQALALGNGDSVLTHNWSGTATTRVGESLPVHWVDLEDVDSANNDLRKRGAERGAATFARGEGLCTTQEGVAFTCTIGGRDRLGQVFHYTPSQFEGNSSEREHPGQLSLIAEADGKSILRNADNIVLAPWGDLIVCEDTADHCGLVGIRADGSMYAIADNAHSGSELAGVCFSPDGSTLFVNIQYPGMTLAITGPWPTA